MDSAKDPEPAGAHINLGFEPDKLEHSPDGVKEPTKAIDVEAEVDDDGPPRANWDSPIEFLLSCIAMSVGLGNVWRFPFVALENGGGAFLLVYLIVLILIGRPIYYLEMCLGQFSSSGPVKVWNLSPFFRGVGYTATFATFCQLTYYTVLISITIFYFFASFAKTLPWTVCQEEWGAERCAAEGTALLYFTEDAVPQYTDIDGGIGTPNWRLTLTLLLAWIIIFGVLVRGVQSSGKVAYFTALFPYLVLFILFGRGVSLSGAWTGVEKFLVPEWKELYNPKVWFEAVGQAFFSLSISFGTIIMFSSYNPFRHNIYRDVIIISVMDTATSLLAGVTIFSILGNLAESKNSTIDAVAGTGGASLAFVAYPEALGQFSWAPQLFAVLFFIMLFTLGLGSASSLTGSVVTIICDQFPHLKNWHVTLGVCIVSFLIGLMYVTPGGMHILDLVDRFASNFVIFIVAMVEVGAISYAYGIRNVCQDIDFMLNRKVGIYFRVCWAYVIPIGMPAILIYWIATFESPIPVEKGYNTLSQVPLYHVFVFYLVFAWLLSATAVSFMVIVAIHSVVTNTSSGLKARILDAMKPSADWGPKSKATRREWLEFKKNK